jgi:hypothetical protein
VGKGVAVDPLSLTLRRPPRPSREALADPTCTWEGLVSRPFRVCPSGLPFGDFGIFEINSINTETLFLCCISSLEEFQEILNHVK